MIFLGAPVGGIGILRAVLWFDSPDENRESPPHCCKQGEIQYAENLDPLPLPDGSISPKYNLIFLKFYTFQEIEG